jgi:hypothetical protein
MAKRKDRPEATAWLTVFTGLIFLYPWIFGWHHWMRLLAVPAALASTLILMFAAGFARGFARDTWPSVPPDLAGKVVTLQAAGWSLDRVHRWWDCTEKHPHVHMSGPESGTPLVLVWDGTTILDRYGNVVRHEV